MKPNSGNRNRLVFFAVILLLSAAPAVFGQVAPPAAFEGITVATADRADTSRMTDGGVVSVKGAGGFVVTLAGELKGRADQDGVIGVLLVPELPFFTNLYRSRKLILSAAEFTAPVNSGSSSYFVSQSKHAAAGFPAYHLFLFNTTGAAATVNVYVNPTRS